MTHDKTPRTDQDAAPDIHQIAQLLVYGSDAVRASIIEGFGADHPLTRPHHESLFDALLHLDFSNPPLKDASFNAQVNGNPPDPDTFLIPLFQSIFEARPDWLDLMDTDLQKTPLMTALEKGYTGLCDYLLEKGANIHQKNAYGYSVIEETIAGGCTSAYKLSFLERCARNGGIEPDQMFLGLVRAAEAKERAICTFFFERGSDELRDEDGKTAIISSLESLNPEAVEMLLSVGCNPKPLDRQHKSPLHYLAETARFYKNDGAAEHLAISFFQAGLSPDQADKNGITARAIAVSSDDPFMIRAIEWFDLQQKTQHKMPGRKGSRL